jgi:hypothetical protein
VSRTLRVRRHFRNPFGPGTMICARHSRFSAKPFHRLHDPLIIGGDDHPPRRLGLLGTFIYSLNHRLSR